jgi:hypothetical protein
MTKLNPTPPIQDLIDAYEAGATIRQIAKQFGGSFQNVNIRLINAGVQMRPASRQRVLPDRTCPTCGTVFRPRHSQQRHCRVECIRSKDTCKRGHPLTENNRYHFPSAHSRCKLCSRMRQRGEI